MDAVVVVVGDGAEALGRLSEDRRIPLPPVDPAMIEVDPGVSRRRPDAMPERRKVEFRIRSECRDPERRIGNGPRIERRSRILDVRVGVIRLEAPVPSRREFVADAPIEGFGAALRERPMSITLLAPRGKVVVETPRATTMSDLSRSGGMLADHSLQIGLCSIRRAAPGDHVHGAKGHVSVEHGLRTLVDLDSLSPIESERIHDRVDPHASEARHTVEQRRDLGARTSGSLPAQEDRASVSPTISTNEVVPRDRHSRDAAQRGGEIESVHVIDLPRRDDRHRAPQTVEPGILEDRLAPDDDLREMDGLVGIGNLIGCRFMDGSQETQTEGEQDESGGEHHSDLLQRGSSRAERTTSSTPRTRDGRRRMREMSRTMPGRRLSGPPMPRSWEASDVGGLDRQPRISVTISAAVSSMAL